MQRETDEINPVLRISRIVAAQLVGGLWPGRDAEWAETRIATLAPARQIAVIGGVLALMLLVSLFAAQFGLLGMAAFFLAVILIVA